jgi:hypothetical protein
VNLTRFSLFFPEKRDFFLEGQGIFNFGGVQQGRTRTARRGNANADLTPILFFSRRIGLTDEGIDPTRASSTSSKADSDPIRQSTPQTVDVSGWSWIASVIASPVSYPTSP